MTRMTIIVGDQAVGVGELAGELELDADRRLRRR